MTQHNFSLPEPDAPRREVEAWLHGWLDRHIPSEWVSLLQDQDEDAALKFIDKFEGFVQIFEVGYTALAEAVDLINFAPKDDWPTHRGPQYLLLAANVKSFRSAQDRLMKGYYHDCGAITRSLYETFARIVFISLFPDAWSSTILYQPSNQRKFNLTNLLKDDLKLEWEPIYGLLSSVSHSNSQAVTYQVVQLSDPDRQPERYGYRNAFDPEQSAAYVNFLDFVLIAHLRVAREMMLEPTSNVLNSIASSLGMALDAQIDRIDGSLYILRRGLRYNSSSFWRRVSDDLDRVMETMQRADSGQDWRALLP